jgi:membrane protein DedA with SNARE-associated domain
MSFVHDFFVAIAKFAIWLISTVGYLGLFVLMILESMFIPIPSELVMPFAGFLAGQGKLSLILVIVVSSIGSIVGSLISYYIGMIGGNVFVLKLGKYFLLDEEDLKKTEKWFAKKGESTILIGRLIPVVRHLISIPAGIGKMHLGKFCAYTLAGATLWNSFLAILGYILAENWNLVRQYSEPLSIIAAVLIVVGGLFFVYHHLKNKLFNKKKKKNK